MLSNKFLFDLLGFFTLHFRLRLQRPLILAYVQSEPANVLRKVTLRPQLLLLALSLLSQQSHLPQLLVGLRDLRDLLETLGRFLNRRLHNFDVGLLLRRLRLTLVREGPRIQFILRLLARHTEQGQKVSLRINLLALDDRCLTHVGAPHFLQVVVARGDQLVRNSHLPQHVHDLVGRSLRLTQRLRLLVLLMGVSECCALESKLRPLVEKEMLECLDDLV